MATTCPKCSYIRKAVENAPDWQCPACGIAYVKYGQTSPGPHARPAKVRGEKFPLVQIMAIVAVTAALVMSVHHSAPVPASPDAVAVGAADVDIYTTPTCGYCHQAMRHMDERGIAYRRHDVEQDHTARQEFSSLGGRGVPLILIGDARMEGFSAGDFDRLYDEKHPRSN